MEVLICGMLVWLTSPDVCYWNGVGCDRYGLSNLTMCNSPMNKPMTAEMIGTLKNLREFRIEGAFFNQTAVPATFTQWKNISMLLLRANNVARPLPRSLVNKKQLWYLYLSHNKFSGELPASYYSLTKLKYHDISGKEIKGSIPISFTKLKALEAFYFEVDDLCARNPQVLACLQSIPSVGGIYPMHYSINRTIR